MENKQQMIHIIAEIVLMIAIVFYFNQKHKKVLSLVEDLAQRVEEQEDLLQKHEEVIKKLVEGFNVLQTEQYKTPPPHAMPQQAMPQQAMPPQAMAKKPVKLQVHKPVKKIQPRVPVVEKIVEPKVELELEPQVELELEQEVESEVEELNFEEELKTELEELEVLEEEITELDTTDLKSNADLKKED